MKSCRNGDSQGAAKHKVVIAIGGVTIFDGYLNDEEYKNFLLANPNPRQLFNVQEGNQ